MAHLTRRRIAPPAAPLLLPTIITTLSLVSFILLANPKDATAADYMPAIRQELARLDIVASCDDPVGFCTYKKELKGTGRYFEIGIRYSKSTDTVYIFIDNYLSVPKDGPSKGLARMLLELNREMVSAKFEWDPSDRAIRISTTINTDSNFDRRAFRSQLLGIVAIATRVYPKVKGLVGPTTP